MKKFLTLIVAIILVFPVVASAHSQRMVLGDVNCDGKVLASDARQILRCTARLPVKGRFIPVLADVNRDGYIHADDARKALRISAQLEPVMYFGEPVPQTENTTVSNTDQINAAEKQIKAFFDRECYFEGVLYEDGVGSPMTLAFKGEDYEVNTNVDGIDISVMEVNGKVYMKRPDTKQYLEMNDLLLEMLGVSLEEITLNLGDSDYDGMAEPEIMPVIINGEEGLRFRYGDLTSYSDFFCIDGQIVEIDVKDENDQFVSQVDIDVFSTSIPDDQLNLVGYTQSESLLDMLGDLIE